MLIKTCKKTNMLTRKKYLNEIWWTVALPKMLTGYQKKSWFQSLIALRCLIFTWNRLTATVPSDKPRTAKGVIFRAKVIELKTATTVKAYRHKEMHRENHLPKEKERMRSWLLFTCTMYGVYTLERRHTCAAVRLLPRAMCRVNVHTLAITTMMGAKPTVRLWTKPAFSSIFLSSDRTSKNTSQESRRVRIETNPFSSLVPRVLRDVHL